jgi:8-oxo-dGTP pyrophosphatase MutT (NUDIX family)
MKQVSLCFCIRDNEVLLGMKGEGFGAGKWNGYGGKLENGESPKTAAIRELREESGLVSEEVNLKQVALVYFYFEGQLAFECHVFLTYSWTGEPVSTAEMPRHQWFAFDSLPLQEMWAADARWIPLILEGKKIKGRVDFNADGTVVNNFSYELVSFD